MIVMKRTYVAESLNDLEDHVYSAINENFEYPKDENGFIKGTFTITIQWNDDEN